MVEDQTMMRPLPDNLNYIKPLQVKVHFQPDPQDHLDHYLVESSTPITREDLAEVGQDVEGITYLGRTPGGAEVPGEFVFRPEGPYWTVVSHRTRPRSMAELFADLRQELGGVNGAVRGILNEMAERLVGDEEQD